MGKGLGLVLPRRLLFLGQSLQGALGSRRRYSLQDVLIVRAGNKKEGGSLVFPCGPNHSMGLSGTAWERATLSSARLVDCPDVVRVIPMTLRNGQSMEIKIGWLQEPVRSC